MASYQKRFETHPNILWGPSSQLKYWTKMQGKFLKTLRCFFVLVITFKPLLQFTNPFHVYIFVFLLKRHPKWPHLKPINNTSAIMVTVIILAITTNHVIVKNIDIMGIFLKKSKNAYQKQKLFVNCSKD